MLAGDFEGGWQDYEQRWVPPNKPPPYVQVPRWDGSVLDGKTILVFAEQGLGDTIQFARFLPQVQERGGTVLFECQSALERLLAGVRGVHRLIPRGSALPPFDVQVPLLSLPGIFHATPASLAAAVPYLRADPGLVERWRRELAPLEGFKVGIVWQGSPHHPADRWRSFPLASFETLLRLDGVRLVSLQKGPGAEQLQAQVGQASNLSSILDLHGRLDAEGAFLDTAAIMMNLDLVITVDSAVAHLAGALAVPVWVPLPFAPDWRWLLERADSPWYPTMRLFRQSRFGDWDEVFARIHDELRKASQLRNKYVSD